MKTWNKPNGGNTVNHAFLFSNGAMTDLNSLIDPASGWGLTSAFDINDAGQIVGSGTMAGQDYAFLLTPIPEPETYAMLLAGLAVVGVAVRRHKRFGSSC